MAGKVDGTASSQNQVPGPVVDPDGDIDFTFDGDQFPRAVIVRPNC